MNSCGVALPVDEEEVEVEAEVVGEEDEDEDAEEQGVVHVVVVQFLQVMQRVLARWSPGLFFKVSSCSFLNLSKSSFHSIFSQLAFYF